jgi:tetratricopeptide (TPR) repeat protein
MKKIYLLVILSFISVTLFSQEDYSSLWNKASKHLSEKNPSEAASIYSKMIDEMKISNDSVFHFRAQAYYDLGEMHKSLTDINTALKLNKSNPDHHFLLGLLKSKSENYPGAIKSFNKAIKINSKNPKYYYDRAIAYLLGEDIDDAVKDLDMAISLKPDYAHAYFSRGYCKHLLGKKDDAVRDLNKSIEFDKTYKEPYIEIALIYLHSGDTVKACEELQIAINAGCTISEEVKKNFCK